MSVSEIGMLTRAEGETAFEHKLRLVSEKLESRLDSSWEELVVALDLECSGDHLRKTAYGLKEAKDYYENLMGQMDMLNEVENKKKEILTERYLEAQKKYEKEKIKVQTLRTDVRRDLREESRMDLFMEEVIEAIRERPSVESYYPTPRKVKESEEMIAIVTDIHYGKYIDIQDPMGRQINYYDEEIFAKRMWEVFNEIVRTAKMQNKKKVHLFNLSDSIDGILRMSQLQSLRKGMTDSVVEFADFMSIWLDKLSEELDVTYYSSLGNHNEIRPLGSRNGDFPHENTERLITRIIQAELKDNKRVEVLDAQNFHYVNILGHDILATHGQNEKNLERAIKDYTTMYDMKIDLMLVGHRHSSHEQTIGASLRGNIEVIQTPSLCGTDSFAQFIKRGSKAGAKILLLEEDRKVKQTIDIVLD